jgi:pentatricopeptide repeat-containing protein PET309
VDDFGEEQNRDREIAVEGAEEGPPQDDLRFNTVRTLRRLLYSDRAGAYDQIFQHYMKLDRGLRDDFTTDVLLAISASTRPIEAWRVNDLFARYPVDEWSEELVRAAVKAQLTLHKVPEAMEIFRTAMEQRGFGGALDYIAAYGFELSSWNLVLEAWELYFSIKGDEEPVYAPPAQTIAEPLETPEVQETGEPVEPTQPRDVEPGTEPTVPADEPLVDSSVGQDAEAEATVAQDIPPAAEPPDEPAGEPATIQDAESDAEPIQGPLPVSGPGYPALAATADFEAKLQELYKFLENDPESISERTALVDSFLRHLVRHSLDLFRPSDVVFMLHRAADPPSYERFIISSVEQDRKRLASDLYKKYRTLPGVRVADSVLRVMVDVFFPHNVAGMEQLLADWYSGYGRLDDRAYHKFMAFYGGRGDVKSIMRLASEYAKHYNSKVEDDPKFVTTLMQAYAVKGDPKAAHQVMEDAADRTGEAPVIKQWNILMNAHAKAGDYGGVIELFSDVCDEFEPDHYTFGTMMGMAGFRGDLQFTLELFQLAKDRGVQPSLVMMRALVEAYCQNDRFAEAEKLCVNVTKKRELPGTYTMLWNALLQHNAKRRDLTTVNRLLEIMSSQGIAYNQETYSHLLLALLYARQSHHAMHLLRVAHREGVFEPTADHFVLLMAAFINSGEPHMALKTNELMANMNYPQSAMRMTKVIDALGRWQQLPYTKRRTEGADHFLKRIMRDFSKAMERVDQGSPDDIRSITGLYSKMLFIMTQMREYATVQQLINMHNSRYPDRASQDTIPLKLLHQIMLADFYEKKYDRVHEIWNIVLQRSSRRYQPASSYLNPDEHQDAADADSQQPGKPVVYAQRFRLCDPLKTMQRLYLEQQDPDGLVELVAQVRRRGFDLDSKNWNYHVQALARLKSWRDAFAVCEEVLMPQWTGWFVVRAQGQVKNQVPLELRRAGTNPHRPRPIAHTLLVLAREYMDLEQMMLWSPEASRVFEYINERCPKTVRAVTTMHRSGSRLEAQIFGEGLQGARSEEPLEGEGGEDESGGEPGEEEEEGREKVERTWRGGRLVRPQEKRRVRQDHRDDWTDDGFLNGGGSTQPKKGQEDWSEEDIVSALKAR